MAATEHERHRVLSIRGTERVNPIGDGGRSLPEALHGLRNLFEVGRRYQTPPSVTHKLVMSRLNHRSLHAVLRSTYDLGVRNFVLQPVKVSGLGPERTEAL